MNSDYKELPLPPYYIIEATNICNFSCSICPNSFYNPAKGVMDIKLLKNILEQISLSAKVIQLYWLGEPLLDEKIFEKIALCKSMTKAKVILSTNGSLLTEETSIELRNSGLDEIVVSVDACESQKIYETIRVGGDLHKLDRNIHSLLKACNNMKVILQFIDLYINKDELTPFLNKWSNCQTEISPLYSWANQIPALNIASDNMNLMSTKTRKPCADLWNKMSIHWNGNVSACCFDFADRLHLGNCQEQTILEIWNGKTAKELRLKHLDGMFDSICKSCDAWAEADEYITMYHL